MRNNARGMCGRRGRWTAMTLAVVMAAAGLGGCGRNAPKADFTFVTGAAHNSFDPQQMSWMHDIRLADCLYVGLVRYDFNTHKVQPGVAKHWRVSKDGLTYTFELRKDAKWSNGDAVTAKDFVYAWRRAMLPDNASQYSHLFWPIKGAKAFFDWRNRQLNAYAKTSDHSEAAAKKLWRAAERRFKQTVGVKAVGADKLVVHLARPVPYFLELAAFITYVPVDAKWVNEAVTLDADSGMRQLAAGYFSDPKRVVTDGPYVLAARMPQQYVYLKANSEYWARKSMGNDSILERIITDPQNALIAYRDGQADWLPDIPTASPLAANLVAQNHGDVHVQPAAGTYFYDFNCEPTRNGKKNPLANARVRRALSMAINRKVIVDEVTRVHQPVARSFIPPGAVPGYHPPVADAVTFDPAKARKLLAAAGYPGGKGLDGLSIMYNTGGGHASIAQAVQAMWAKTLGVHVTLEVLPLKAFSQRLRNHAFSIARGAWFGDYPDPTSWLEKMHTGDGNNDCAWSNKKFDALLAKAKGLRDQTKRMAVLRQAADILQKQQPMALIFQYVMLNVYNKRKVHDLDPNAWGRFELEKVRVSK